MSDEPPEEKRPEEGAAARPLEDGRVERTGPLAVTRYIKRDGRPLLLYARGDGQ